jgi:type I restriction enzyme S subunit
MPPWVIPNTWTWVRIGEITEVIGGGTPRTSESANFRNGQVPWVTPADLSGYKEKYIERGARNITEEGLKNSAARLLPTGTVLFSSRAPIGYVAIARNPLATNQGFKSFVLPCALDPVYVYYYLQRARELALGLASGTTFPEVSGRQAAKIPLPIAPLPEQHRIVEAIESHLTRLDDAVATLERVQRNLKRYRASVLKAAVEGRLVPIEAELARAEGRDYEPASVLLERILAERRRRWEEAELAKLMAKGRTPKDDKWKAKYKEPVAPDTRSFPDLPDGWSWATVASISSKVVDGVHKKPSYVEEGVPFVTVKNLTAGPGISFESLRYITQDDHEKFIARANPERGDLLVSKDGTLGVIRAIRTDRVFSIFVSVALVKPTLLEMSDYLEIALSSPVMQVQMIPKGSGLQHIHLEDLRADCVPVPPLAEATRICTEVQRHISMIDELEREVAQNVVRCVRLRQSILKWAFEGRLVDQDPTDESASVLLERIRAEREAKPAQRARTRRRARAAKTDRP